ncbi:MAG: Gmad2 immunoglobulin-like domain-containing protein [Candidatus Campbellbacteria bacterium]|nr:Gmad2 immunoglobulin-like domain-containing protein [Candidatus Campbellbacteria bacterium]
MSSQRNTFVLVGSLACAFILISIGVFYFLLRTPDAKQYNLDGTMLSQKTEEVSKVRDEKAQSISVFTPRFNERVGSPVSISGEMTLPQTALYYRLKNESGDVLSSGYVTTEHTASQATNAFQGNLTYTSVSGGNGTVEVFVLSEDGASELFLVTIPVFYTETPTLTKK